MTTIARRVASTPKRSPSETWNAISELLCEHNKKQRSEFGQVAGLMSSIIADQAPEDEPFTIIGSGPRIRIYCAYGDRALELDGDEERSLVQDPLANKWVVHVPVLDEDFDWVKTALKENSRFRPFNARKGLTTAQTERARERLDIDQEAWSKL